MTPIHVRQVRKLAHSSRLEASSPPPRAGRDDVTLICVIRDEEQRLESFLSHYRALGIRDFRFIDNGSADGSVDMLAAQPDCTVYLMPGPFSWQRKQAWIHVLIQQHDPQGWYLVVDADEKLVFSGCENHPVGELITWLEARNLNRARALLLDVYPHGPLLPPDDSPVREPHEWFDASGYISRKKRHMPSLTGGPRYRTFQFEGQPLDPELTKLPLFKASPGDIMSNPHHHYPYADNFSSPCLLALLHEKFDNDFSRRVKTAVEEGQYWNGSLEYRAYANALEQNPALSLWTGESRRYSSSDDLSMIPLIEELDWSGQARQR